MMEKELKCILDKCKEGYEMYPLYCKINNMILFLEGKEKKKNILVNYNSIDDVTVLIKLKNCISSHFVEEAEELQRVLDNKLIKYKKYVKYCRSLNPYPLEPKYYSHITDSINKLEDNRGGKTPPQQISTKVKRFKEI